MNCKYCIPNKRGRRKPIYVERFYLRSHPVEKIKRNITSIYRERNNKKKYFIGTHSMDVSEDGKVMFRNNGFIMKKLINFCPICGRDFSIKLTGGQ